MSEQTNVIIGMLLAFLLGYILGAGRETIKIIERKLRKNQNE